MPDASNCSPRRTNGWGLSFNVTWCDKGYLEPMIKGFHGVSKRHASKVYDGTSRENTSWTRERTSIRLSGGTESRFPLTWWIESENNQNPSSLVLSQASAYLLMVPLYNRRTFSRAINACPMARRSMFCIFTAAASRSSSRVQFSARISHIRMPRCATCAQPASSFSVTAAHFQFFGKNFFPSKIEVARAQMRNLRRVKAFIAIPCLSPTGALCSMQPCVCFNSSRRPVHDFRQVAPNVAAARADRPTGAACRRQGSSRLRLAAALSQKPRVHHAPVVSA